jgi:hypothetical protein
MLTVSYAAAATAMFVAALYLFFRLRLYLTTTTMLVGALLLIYGPAFLAYTLFSGEYAGLIRHLSGTATVANPLWTVIRGKVEDFDAIVVAMNFSIALMYASVIAGIEIVDRLIPKRIAALRTALTSWNAQALRDDLVDSRILFGVISSVALFMFFVSFSENHITTIKDFWSASAPDGARNAIRLHHSGSASYSYRVILGAIAPMFVIWGVLASWLNRSWWLLFSSILLFLTVVIGKLDTLSKAPPAFFLIQLMVAALLTFTNRITWRNALAGACVVALVFYVVTRLIVASPEGIATLEFVYSRVFEVESETLLENFAAFPFMHPFMLGANIRPFAILRGLDYMPAFSIVAQIWHGTYDVTSPSLFIADAWADFSYAGVIVFSLIAGAVCRSIDAIFLVQGKTVVGVAVLGAAFFGVFNLLVTALSIAFISGGLLLAPVLAGFLVTATRYVRQRNPTSPIVAQKE